MITTGNKIGEIDHLMIDKVSGNVRYAVMSFGGFLGLGHSHYPLPWNALQYDRRARGIHHQCYRRPTQGCTGVQRRQLDGSGLGGALASAFPNPTLLGRAGCPRPISKSDEPNWFSLTRLAKAKPASQEPIAKLRADLKQTSKYLVEMAASRAYRCVAAAHTPPAGRVTQTHGRN